MLSKCLPGRHRVVWRGQGYILFSGILASQLDSSVWPSPISQIHICEVATREEITCFHADAKHHIHRVLENGISPFL